MSKWTVKDSSFYKQNAIYRGETWIATLAENEAAQNNAAYLVECANIRESLKDPAVVYANVLRGEIANPAQSEIAALQADNAQLREALLAMIDTSLTMREMSTLDGRTQFYDRIDEARRQARAALDRSK